MRPPSRLRAVVLALTCVAAAWLCAHGVMGRLATWAERDEGAYLWWREEMMQLFTPANYVGLGEGRIILTGPSEVREAFLPDVMSERLGRDCYQNALSLGTLDAVVMQLEYLERFYGASAMPDVFLIGVTPRFASNAPPLDQTPFRDYVDRFSPYAFIDVEAHSFAEKNPLHTLAARLRHLAHQPRRYKGALRAARRAAMRAVGRDVDDHQLRPSKFHHRGVMPKGGYFKIVAEEGRIPWTLEENEAAIRRGFGRIRALCERHGATLVLVAMPEGSWARSDLHYPPGYYEKLLSLIRSAAGVQPINLRGFLRDGEFHDWSHPTRRGAERVTRAVCDRIIEVLPVPAAAR